MNLPLEIWYMIGNHIDDYKTLIDLSSTSKSLRNLFKNHSTIILAKQNTYIRWEICCEDEDKNHTLWSDGTTIPQHCPINHDHNIDITKTRIIDRCFNNVNLIEKYK